MQSQSVFEIKAENLGKRYVQHWIFRGIEGHWQEGQRIAIVGGNGSGKSTFLQVLSGILPPTEGQLTYHQAGQLIDIERYHRYLSIASPALDLPESLSLRQLLIFHLQLKPLVGDNDVKQVAERMDLAGHLDKDLRLFSSGMRQRVKLGLAMWAALPLILLDEPTSHLDTKYIGWYQEQLSCLGGDKLVFVASNDAREYVGFQQLIQMGDLSR